jgi:hypothetical protein
MVALALVSAGTAIVGVIGLASFAIYQVANR